MPVIHKSVDQVVVSPIIAPPIITVSGNQSAGSSYTTNEQQMLQASYDAHRNTKVIK